MRLMPVLTTAALVTATVAQAQAPAHDPNPKDARVPVQVRQIPADPGPASPLVAVRDAETGELRAPTPEEWARLAPYVKHTQGGEGLIETTYSDGSVNVQLDGRYDSFSIAHRDPSSGTVSHQCEANAQTLANLILGLENPASENRDDQ